MIDKMKRPMTNYVLVNFVSKDGTELTDPLKIYGLVGGSYKVNTPSFDGYILTGHEGDALKGTVSEDSKNIRLIYEKLGKLIIKHSLNGKGEELPFLTSIRADQVATVDLPDPGTGRAYYPLINENGGKKLGEPIENYKMYVPKDPTKVETIVELSADQAEEYRAKLAGHDNVANVNQKDNDNIILFGNDADLAEQADEKEKPASKETSVADEVIKTVSQLAKQSHSERSTSLNDDVREGQVMDAPLVILSDAFAKVVKGLIAMDEKGQLTDTQKVQLIAKAESLLKAMRALNN